VTVNVTNQILSIVGSHLSNFVVPETWLNGRVYGLYVQICTPLFLLFVFRLGLVPPMYLRPVTDAGPPSPSFPLFTTYGYLKTPKLPFFLLAEVPPIPESETVSARENPGVSASCWFPRR
jgi:hypothetical protein